MFVRSHSYVHQAKTASAGVGRANINAKNLAKVRLVVPPLSEQSQIIDAVESYFSRLDEAEAALERVQRNLKRYRAAVLQAAVEGRLVPTEAELARAEGRTYEPASELLKRILVERRRRWADAELARLRTAGKAAKDDETKEACDEPPQADASTFPTLPEGWRWASIDQLGEVSGGLTKNARRHALGHHLPYLRVANVYADELRLEDVQTIGVADSEIPRTLLYRGDLLVVEGNGSLDQIGRVAVWDGSVHPCLHQNHIIKVRLSPPTVSAWALSWLVSPLGRAEIQRVASSTSGLHTLSLSKVGKLPLPVPPLAEQIRIQAEEDGTVRVARKR
jgi:type I restriction enzyme S subunit